MKSQEPLNQHQNVQKSETNFNFEVLQCSKGNPSVMLCQNKKCTKLSFICSKKDCQCQSNHKKCMKTFAEQFFNELNKKIRPTQVIRQKIDSIIDGAIDYISRIRDEIELNLKYLGLNEDEKQLMELLSRKQFDSISGAKIWKVCHTIYEQKQISSAQITKEINKFWNTNEKTFKKSFEKLKDLAQKETQNFSLFKDSSIIENPSDTDVICNFFDEYIFKTKLLYSAQKNKYNLLKYYNDCHGKKNILYVIKGKQGKVFGCFVDKEVQKLGGGMLVMSSMQVSNKAFVFSLTNKDKFNLTKKSTTFSNTPLQEISLGNDFLAIYRNEPEKYKRNIQNPPVFGQQNMMGNAFGGGFINPNNQMGFGNGGGFGFGGFGQPPPQLGDLQKELTHNYCVVLQGSAFHNDKYKSDEQSRMRFAGTSEKIFSIQQWEAHQIFFEDDNQ